MIWYNLNREIRGSKVLVELCAPDQSLSHAGGAANFSARSGNYSYNHIFLDFIPVWIRDFKKI